MKKTKTEKQSAFKYYFTMALSIIDMIPPLLLWFGQVAVALLAVCLIIGAFDSLFNQSYRPLLLQLAAAGLAIGVSYMIILVNKAGDDTTDQAGRS